MRAQKAVHYENISLFIMKVKPMMQNIWIYQNKIHYCNFDASLISLRQSSNEKTESCSENLHNSLENLVLVFFVTKITGI